MKAARVAMRRTADAVQISATIVLVIFIIFYVNVFLKGMLNQFGIFPRTSWGLLGILFSPLLHANTAHLMANGISLFILLFILFLYKEYKGDQTLMMIWLVGGFGTWLIGRPAMHIGASGVLYGIVTYLICAAWWLRSWRSAFMAIAVFLVYGGIFYGVLPQKDAIISWEGHLCGAIAGWWAARQQHA